MSKHRRTDIILLYIIGVFICTIPSVVYAPLVATNYSFSTIFQLGAGPSSLALVDLDKNRKLDLISSTALDGQVRVSFGTGTFAAPTVSVATGSRPRSVMVGDFNQDTIQDVVVANQNSGTVSLMYADGSANVATALGTPAVTDLNVFEGTGVAVSAIALGDLDGDPQVDVIAISSNVSGTFILLNTGGPAFSTSQLSGVGIDPIDVRLADLNADNFADILVLDHAANSVLILVGTAIATWSRNTVAVSPFGSSPVMLKLADLNKDTELDLVVANSDPVNPHISVRLADATPVSYLLEYTYPTQSQQYWVEVADLNADGNLDIVYANSASSPASLGILQGNGAGSFQAEITIPLPQTILNPQAGAVGDVNGDGDLDVVVAGYDSSNGIVIFSAGAAKATSPPSSTTSAGTTPSAQTTTPSTQTTTPSTTSTTSTNANSTDPSSSTTTPSTTSNTNSTSTAANTPVPIGERCNGSPLPQISTDAARNVNWTCVNDSYWWNAEKNLTIEISAPKLSLPVPISIDGSVVITDKNATVTAVYNGKAVMNVTGNATLAGTLVLLINSSDVQIPYKVIIGQFPNLITPFDHVAAISASDRCVEYQVDSPAYDASGDKSFSVLLTAKRNRCGRSKFRWWIAASAAVAGLIVIVLVVIAIGYYLRTRGKLRTFWTSEVKENQRVSSSVVRLSRYADL